MRNIDLRGAYESMYISESVETEEELNEEGKKDACYHKVKSRYDVWPSAYASGALVKCRRAGAKNWGNSPKKEDLEMVFAFLINEGFAETEDDAISMIEGMTETWYEIIMEDLITEAYGEPDADTAMARHGIKKHEGPMKVTKLKPRGMRKGEGLGVGARKRQGAGKPDEQGQGGPVRFQ